MNIDMNIYVYEFLFINWNLSANLCIIRLGLPALVYKASHFISLICKYHQQFYFFKEKITVVTPNYT